MKRIILSLGFLAILSSVFIVSCDNKTNQVETVFADYIFTNAKIYTVNSHEPWAEAIAISGDSILFVGNDKQASSYLGPHTKEMDVDGKLILPGFIDAHAHPLLTAMLVSGYMGEPTNDISELLAGIKEHVNNHPEEEIIFGFGGFYMGQYALNSKMLDEIDSSRPIIMIEDGGHGAWANSKAFEVLGIDNNFPDPMPGYSYYERDDNNFPTGQIMEIAAYVYMLDQLKIIQKDKLKPSMAGVAEMMNELGYTSMYDAGVFAPLDETIYPIISEFAQEGRMNLRISASYAVKSMDKLKDAVPKLNEYQKFNHGTFQINTFKSYVDGTMESRTAAMDSDYLDTPGNKGTLAISGDEFYTTLIDLAKNDYNIHLHAMGPKAIHEVLVAGAKVRDAGYHEVTITNAHTQLVRDEDMAKFKEFDIIPNTSAVWHIYSGDVYLPTLGEECFSKLFRYESLAKSGIGVTIGTDYPAAEGGVLGANPLVQMQCAITRQKPVMFGEDERIQPPLDERMSVAHAIEAFTINGAKQMRMENKIGSLETGKKADLIILSDNIFDIEKDQIANTTVLFTLFGGEVVHDKVFLSEGLNKFEDINIDIELCDDHDDHENH